MTIQAKRRGTEPEVPTYCDLNDSLRPSTGGISRRRKEVKLPLFINSHADEEVTHPLAVPPSQPTTPLATFSSSGDSDSVGGSATTTPRDGGSDALTDDDTHSEPPTTAAPPSSPAVAVKPSLRTEIVDEEMILPRCKSLSSLASSKEKRASIAHMVDTLRILKSGTVDELMQMKELGSPRFGASVTFDPTAPESPKVRVRTYTVGESTVAATLAVAPEHGKLTTTTEEHNFSQSGGGSSSNSRLSSSTSRLTLGGFSRKKKNTYTLIEYNSDPLCCNQWQKFLVPNSEIGDSTRLVLERANARDCVQCGGFDDEGINDKIAAILLVETQLFSSRGLGRANKTGATKKFEGCRVPQGLWARMYRVLNSGQTNFEETPCTYFYRFRMFA